MHNDNEPGNENYEQSDVNVKLIFWSGVGVTVLTLVSFMVSYVIVEGLNRREPATDHRPHELAEEHNEWTTGVRLQNAPWDDYDALEAEQTEAASTYGAMSENPPVYRIPVEEAMALVVEQGRLPEFQSPIAMESTVSRDEAEQESDQ